MPLKASDEEKHDFQMTSPIIHSLMYTIYIYINSKDCGKCVNF